MASLHKDPRGKSEFWYCAFTNADGKRSFKSTKEREHSKADEICRGWAHAAKSGRQKTLTEIQVRKVLGDIYERTTGEQIEFDTIAGYLESWLKSKAKVTAPNTHRIYKDAVNDFIAHL